MNKMRKKTFVTLLGLAFFSMMLLQLVSVSVRANTIPATVNIDPDSLRLEEGGYGKWMTAYIQLPDGLNVSEIDVSSVTLEVMGDSVPASMSDIQEDTLMVKFDRTMVIGLLLSMIQHMSPHVKQEVTLEVTGNLFDGNSFVGSDTIGVFFTQP